MPGSLLGLGMGTILANFHICGVIFKLTARLRIAVRYWMASGPRCFKWRMFMWSGPVELLLDDLDIASKTCVAVMCMGLDDKALVCLSTFLFVVFVACWMVLTNCLLKAEAFCSGVIAGLSWKVTMVFDCGGGFFPLR